MAKATLLLILFIISLTCVSQSKIIFSRGEGSLNTGETPDLMIYNPVDQSTKLLMKGSVKRRGESNAVTSPDNSKIIFNTYRYSGWKLAIADLNNDKITNIKRFTNRPNYEYNASWSSDSKKITYQEFSWGTRDTELFIYDTVNKKTSQLTKSEGGDRTPDWTYDDKYIIFTSGRSDSYNIYRTLPDGIGTKNLTNSKEHHIAPSCSPVNNKIAFLATRNKHLHLFTMDIDGKGLKNITPNLISNRFNSDSWQDSASWAYKTSWSPDGKHIVFNMSVDGDLEVFIVGVDGSSLTQITDNKDSDFAPFWMN